MAPGVTNVAGRGLSQRLDGESSRSAAALREGRPKSPLRWWGGHTRVEPATWWGSRRAVGPYGGTTRSSTRITTTLSWCSSSRRDSEAVVQRHHAVVIHPAGGPARCPSSGYGAVEEGHQVGPSLV